MDGLDTDALPERVRDLLERLIKWKDAVDEDDDLEYLNVGPGWEDIDAMADEAWEILNP